MEHQGFGFWFHKSVGFHPQLKNGRLRTLCLARPMFWRAYLLKQKIENGSSKLTKNTRTLNLTNCRVKMVC